MGWGGVGWGGVGWRGVRGLGGRAKPRTSGPSLPASPPPSARGGRAGGGAMARAARHHGGRRRRWRARRGAAGSPWGRGRRRAAGRSPWRVAAPWGRPRGLPACSAAVAPLVASSGPAGTRAEYSHPGPIHLPSGKSSGDRRRRRWPRTRYVQLGSCPTRELRLAENLPTLGGRWCTQAAPFSGPACAGRTSSGRYAPSMVLCVACRRQGRRSAARETWSAAEVCPEADCPSPPLSPSPSQAKAYL
jgi:hypothetical protein